MESGEEKTKKKAKTQTLKIHVIRSSHSEDRGYDIGFIFDTVFIEKVPKCSGNYECKVQSYMQTLQLSHITSLQ